MWVSLKGGYVTEYHQPANPSTRIEALPYPFQIGIDRRIVKGGLSLVGCQPPVNPRSQESLEDSRVGIEARRKHECRLAGRVLVVYPRSRLQELHGHLLLHVELRSKHQGGG